MAPSRASTKRRRISSGVAVDVNGRGSQNKHEVFTQWAKDRGVQIRSVKPAQIPGRGVGLVTTASIKQDERLIFVPEKAMFKPVKNYTSSNMSLKASPHVQLALSIMTECENPESSYNKWRSTWPTIQDFQSSMPLFWNHELSALLPPSVQHPLERQIDDWKKDAEFHRTMAPAGEEEDDTMKYFWAIVNSRSFHFKPPGSKPGFMVLCPFIDYMNHGPSGTGINVRQMAKGYEVTANRDYVAGEEVLATYGAHPNDKLLVHYGFINSSGPGAPSDDDVRLDHYVLDNLSSTTRDQLQDVGYLGSYALLPATNEICFKTQVAVRAELLTANEWEYFISNGEDLSNDQSEKVNRWLEPFLDGYRSDAESKIAELKAMKPGESEAGPVQLLLARWQQIHDALDAFIREG
ncbi:SET domain-containing protein 4 [Pseudocercospora fuligena]|uniref:SET domain-containing protein 4 n=1 Tax=Pseudocercospora fuligena TaxID=685502 RepID=A0A8H6R6Y2_9PEZI|nr:SET domain-containing protein 4 [Pseudocercospora fuligena]